VVIKGTSCAGARRLAVHLMRTDTNERAEVKELHGVSAETLRQALLEMEAVATGTRSTKPFYHASINTRADERLTEEQRAHAIDRLEAALDLTGQARVVVVHEKEGREHCHIVWSRIDLDRMAAISDSHNYRKHEEVARALEREFGHERVQGAHVERDGRPRPERTPSHAEMLQAERTGLSAKQVKEQVTELWRQTTTGQEFAVALWQAGYVLARGDRRDYVIIDPRGGTHSLARRIEEARVKDIRERMGDLEPSRLPSITEAKEIQRARQARDAERELEERKAGGAGAAEEHEWTHRAGMVQQQRSALDWVEQAAKDRRDLTEQSDRSRKRSERPEETTEELQKRREALMRKFGQEQEETTRDPDEHDRGRERSR
jgi:Relaxase/Mobilisation nuclease domain